jgi:hypothetical protein
MHTTGMSFKAIGRQMGYHYTVVSRLVRKHTQTSPVLKQHWLPNRRLSTRTVRNRLKKIFQEEIAWATNGCTAIEIGHSGTSIQVG